MFYFTDLIPDQETKYTAGWVFIFQILVFLIPNFISVVISGYRILAMILKNINKRQERFFTNRPLIKSWLSEPLSVSDLQSRIFELNSNQFELNLED